MEDTFIININDQGKDYEFETRILWLGYQHKIEVIIDQVAVLFEPDEERHYRAVINPEQASAGKWTGPGLLQVIALHLESFLKDE